MKKYLHVSANACIEFNINISIRLVYNNKTEDKLNIYLIKSSVPQKHYNFIIPNAEDVFDITYEYPTILEGIVHFFETDEPIVSTEQKMYERKYSVQTEMIDDIKLSFCSEYTGSQTLLVMFPGFIDLTSELQYPITWLKDINCNKLSFLDKYLVNGTYMLCDDNGQLLEKSILAKINDYCNKHQILEKDIVFFGTSKGGTIALNIGKFFPKASIVSVVPQLDLDIFFGDTYIFGNFHKNVLGKFLQDNNVSYDFSSTLFTINESKQKCFIYNGENDYFSNSIALTNYSSIEEILGKNMAHNQVISSMKSDYISKLRQLLFSSDKLSLSFETHKKYLNINFHYEEIKETVQEIMIKENGKNLYRVFPPSKKEGVLGKFYNIVLPNEDATYELITTLSEPDFDFFFSDERTSTPIEIERDQKYQIIEEKINGKSIYYSETESDQPKQLVVTFPGFYYHYKDLQYTISSLSSMTNNSFSAILAFQDRYFIEGTYMQIDDNGNKLKDAIVTKINDTLKKYNLTSKELIVFGASKGGTIALSFLNEFPKAKFIATVPQLNLDHYREGRPHLNGSLINLFKKYQFDYENELDIVRNIYNHPNTDIFMFNGIDDQLSNNGRFVINNDLKNLKVINSDIWHNGVTNFTEIVWKNMLASGEKIDTAFYCSDDANSLNGIEMFESGKITEDEYTDIMPIIEFWSLDGELMVFATPIAKLKGDNGKVNKFVNADIDNYLYDYHKILIKDKYLVQLSVYSSKGKIYCGKVLNHSGQQCIYDSSLNSILWLSHSHS